MWLDAVAAPVGRKDHKCDLCLGKSLLTGYKFRQNQNFPILFRDLTGFDGLLLLHKDFFHPAIRPLVSTITFKFVLQDHSGHIHCLKKGFIRSSFCIPGRIEIADERRQFVFLPGIIIVVQRLHEGFVERSCQFFSQDLCSQCLPQKAEGCIRHAIFPNAAVLLMMVVSSSSDIKHQTVKVFRNPVAPADLNLRIQIQEKGCRKHII